MPKEIAGDPDPPGLEDCDGRCRTMSEKVWVDRLPKGLTGSLGYDPGNSITSKWTAFCASPDPVMAIGSVELRTHFLEVILQ